MPQAPRDRIPLATDYATALGQATYCFAVCEWNVVWCCERIRPKSLLRFREEGMTAGKIGRYFKELVRNLERSSPLRERLEPLAHRFLEAVQTRNSILHGKPGTTKDDEQRLIDKAPWGIAELNQAADEFALCSFAFNEVLYKELTQK